MSKLQNEQYLIFREKTNASHQLYRDTRMRNAGGQTEHNFGVGGKKKQRSCERHDDNNAGNPKYMEDQSKINMDLRTRQRYAVQVKQHQRAKFQVTNGECSDEDQAIIREERMLNQLQTINLSDELLTPLQYRMLSELRQHKWIRQNQM